MQRTVGIFAGALLAALSVLVAPALASGPAAASAQPDFRQYLTVKFSGGTSADQRADARAAVGATYKASIAGPQLQQVAVPAGDSARAAAAAIERQPGVEFAVASGTYRADDSPTPYFSDPFYDDQWALQNIGQVFMSRLVGSTFQNVSGTPGADIDAPAAWDALSPAQRANVERIGVVDTGVAYQHPDLIANAAPGYDFYDDDADPRDYDGHGTHVASIAAGVANNGIGTVGVDPWAKIMPLRASDEYGTFSWAAIAQAVSYGLSNGVRVFNGSFGGPDDDPAFEDLIAQHQDALFIFSAGNGGSDGVGDNHDSASGLAHRFPCDSQLPNVICVGASDWNDAIAGFSDYGTSSVDLLAPGSSVYAAKPCTVPASDVDHQGECPYNADDPLAPVGLGGGPYGFQLLSGTSMAAPAVAGTAALLWQRCPSISAAAVKSAIVGTVKQLPAVRTKVAYGGRLDAGAALASVAASDCANPTQGTDWPTPPAQPTSPGGAGDAGGTTTTPTPPTGSVTPGGGQTGGAAGALSFTIVRPARARVGRSSKVSFKLRCSATCSAALTVRPSAKHNKFKLAKVRVKERSAGTKTVSIRLSRSVLAKVRKLLARRVAVSLRISAVVSDAAGASSKPVTFSIRLAR